MTPDLGKYMVAVAGSYLATFVLLALLIGVSWWQSRKTRERLAEAEDRARKEMMHGT